MHTLIENTSPGPVHPEVVGKGSRPVRPQIFRLAVQPSRTVDLHLRPHGPPTTSGCTAPRCFPWTVLILAGLLTGASELGASPPRQVHVSAVCLSVSVGPFTGTLPGTGPVTTSLATFRESSGYPLHTVLPNGTQIFNGELAPTSTSSASYSYQYVTFNPQGTTNQFGAIHLDLPLTDSESIGLPDILQPARSVAASFTGSGTIAWPVVGGFGVSGQMTRGANAINGTFAVTLSIQGLPATHYNGPFRLLTIEGEADYERLQDQSVPYLTHISTDTVAPRDSEVQLRVVAGHRIEFTLKRHSQTGGEESLSATTSFTVVGPNEIVLPAFTLVGPGVQYDVQPLSLKRSGHRYSGPLTFADGDPKTPWVDFGKWVIVLTDENDEDNDGVPDISDPASDPGLRFQWFLNGAPLAGGTNADLMLHALGEANSGSYQAVVQNKQGITTSNPVRVACMDFYWATKAGGRAFDNAQGLASGTDGAFHLAGNIRGDALIDTVPIRNLGAVTGFIARYDRSGQVRWVMPLQSTGGFEVAGVVADANGGSRWMGQFYGGALVGTNTLSGAGSIIGRTDATGRTAWIRTPPERVTYSAIALDPAGNTFIGGTSATNSTWAGQNIQPGVFVAKYDPDGTLLWVRSHFIWAGSDYDRPSIAGITVNREENVFVTGSLYSRDLLGYSRQGLVACWDASGNEKWFHEFGGNGTDSGQSVVSDSEGNLFVAAAHSSSWLQWDGTVIHTGTGDAVVGLLKITSTGQLMWWRTLAVGTSDGSALIGLSADGHGRVCLASRYFNWGTTLQIEDFQIPDKPGSVGMSRAFMAEFDREGQIGWVWRMPSSVDASNGGIAYDLGGNLSVAYSYRGGAQLGSFELSNAGITDILLFTLRRPPQLAIHRTANGLRASWPSSWWDAPLESSDSLDAAGVWIPTPAPVTSSGIDLSTDLAPDSPQRFFRLHLPPVSAPFRN